jgi:glutathione S-transferase
MLVLYDSPSSGNAYKVRLMLAKLGLAHRRVVLDIDRAETRTPAFLAKNPNGRVPALELGDGTVLAESNAILYYLAEATPYWPAERVARAQVLQWMFFEQYSHEPYIAVARFILHHLPADHARRQSLPELQTKGRAALNVMEGHLADRRFLVGEGCTIADLALYAYTHVADEGGFDLAPYPAVRQWLERVRRDPGHVPISA